VLVQGLWADKDSVLLQLPHFTPELAPRCAAGGGDEEEEMKGAAAAAPVESVFDVMEMEDGARRRLLRLGEAELADVARFCNRFPSINVRFEVAAGDASAAGGGAAEGEGAAPPAVQCAAGDTVSVVVTLERDASTEGMEEGAGVGAVFAPLFPAPKSEGWWVVVGQPGANAILAIKRVALAQRLSVTLEFPAPAPAGGAGAEQLVKAQVLLISDAYLGVDQEYALELLVSPAREEAGAGAGDGDGAEEAMR
jgi:pre-mRNA-splicing helicase BRR2